MKKSAKLTSWEWDGLVSKCNLADGHAHQSQTKKQLKIIKRLPSLFLRAEKETQDVVQAEFEKLFFIKAGQHYYKYLPPPQYHYACSLAIEALANYLREAHMSLTLIHPTFDNLADIFKRHDINLIAIDEENLTQPDELEKINTDALMIVYPNNPTGQELTKEEFKKILKVCSKKKILLIIDSSFRFYSGMTSWDQYEILYKSGIDFVVFEDTGKTFPTLDLKLGIIISSQSIYNQLNDITNDFLLNVSPFIFKLLSAYIGSGENQGTASYQEAVEINRKCLINALKNTPVKIHNPTSKLSVAWIKLPSDWKSSIFCKWLETKGIHVLPGIPFFWNDNKKGEAYFRVALARPAKFFETTVIKLKKCIEEYKKLHPIP